MTTDGEGSNTYHFMVSGIYQATHFVLRFDEIEEGGMDKCQGLSETDELGRDAWWLGQSSSRAAASTGCSWSAVLSTRAPRKLAQIKAGWDPADPYQSINNETYCKHRTGPQTNGRMWVFNHGQGQIYASSTGGPDGTKMHCGKSLQILNLNQGHTQCYRSAAHIVVSQHTFSMLV